MGVVFSWSISDPDGDTLSCTVEFGDETEAATVSSCTSASTQAHSYAADGEYTATLTVSDGKNSSSESTTISVGSPPPPPPPPPECDNANNDTFATAYPLALDTPCKGTIAESGDTDYFQVAVDKAGVLVMTLDPVPSDVRMNINLYNESQREIVNTFFGNGGQARTLVQLEDAGTYYIILDGRSSDSSP